MLNLHDINKHYYYPSKLQTKIIKINSKLQHMYLHPPARFLKRISLTIPLCANASLNNRLILDWITELGKA